MAAAFKTATVKWIRHWNDRLFSFAVERESSFRFENGHFIMDACTLLQTMRTDLECAAVARESKNIHSDVAQSEQGPERQHDPRLAALP